MTPELDRLFVGFKALFRGNRNVRATAPATPPTDWDFADGEVMLDIERQVEPARSRR